MTLRQLRCFVAVVETGRFSHAAVRLRMAQPGLSLQITNLERQLGVALLSRDQTGARPTRLGAQLYRDARHILNRFDQIGEDFAGMGSGADAVTLGFASDCGPSLSRAVAAALMAGHPGVWLRLVEASAPELDWRLEDGSLDLSVVYEAGAGREAPGCDDRAQWALFSQRLFYVAKNGAPPATPLGSLLDRTLVLPPRPSAVRAVLDEAFESRGIRPRIIAEADTPGMLLGLVGSSDAGTVLPWMGPPDPSLSWSPVIEPSLAVTAVLKTGKARLSAPLAGIIRRTVMAVAAAIQTPPTSPEPVPPADGHIGLCINLFENDIGGKET